MGSEDVAGAAAPVASHVFVLAGALPGGREGGP